MISVSLGISQMPKHNMNKCSGQFYAVLVFFFFRVDHMPGSMIGMLNASFPLIDTTLCHTSSVAPVLQMRKPRHREVKSVVQSHTAVVRTWSQTMNCMLYSLHTGSRQELLKLLCVRVALTLKYGHFEEPRQEHPDFSAAWSPLPVTIFRGQFHLAQWPQELAHQT